MENRNPNAADPVEATVVDEDVKQKPTWMDQLKIHPASALLVIALDTALFGGNVMAAGILTLITSGVGFLGSFFGVTLIEKFLGREPNGRSVAKGFMLGILTGIPTSIATTALGALILTLGGISKFNSSKILPKPDNRPRTES